MHRQNSEAMGRFTAKPLSSCPDSHATLSGPECVGVPSYRHPVSSSSYWPPAPGLDPDWRCPVASPIVRRKKIENLRKYFIDFSIYLSENNAMDVAAPLPLGIDTPGDNL